jgi:Replication-relaxation
VRGPYVTSRRVTELRASLSDEAWAVLHDVATMRLAQATDLQALRSLEGPVGARHFRRLLARLSGEGVLARLDRRIGGASSGSAGWVYGLGLAGRRLLDDGVGRPRPPWTPRAAWLNHALAVSRLYVRLRELEASGHLKLERFDAEPRCWRSFIGQYGARATLKPDVCVVTVQADDELHWFVEVDCGTESPATLARKLDTYRQYWQTGLEQHRSGVFPRVLWLVPEERRQALLIEVAGRQPADAWKLHQITTYDRFNQVVVEEPP